MNPFMAMNTSITQRVIIQFVINIKLDKSLLKHSKNLSAFKCSSAYIFLSGGFDL